MLSFLQYLFSFIAILSFIVFIHEFGHYFFAKKFGVKIEAFAIGFGKTLFSWQDKSGTIWKICILPLGGYVKMYGDTDVASTGVKKQDKILKDKAFFFKPLYKKFLIVLAGPLFNYLLGIVILFFIFAKFGVNTSSTIINQVQKDMPAYVAGLKPQDKIISVDNKKIKNFSEIQRIVQISPNIPLKFTVARNKKNIDFTIIPQKKESKDFLGNKINIGLVGITVTGASFKEVSYFQALPLAVTEVWDISVLTLKTLKQLILGQRSISDLSGPLKIAKYSGQVTKKSFSKDKNGDRNIYLLFWFIAMISINLGLVNLLPIPILDGGHLFIYMLQAIRRKEISAKTQEYIFRLGFAFLITIFIIVLISDLKFIFS